jgi:hypothetical protein
MNTRPHLGWKIAGAAACLYALWVVANWPRVPAEAAEFRRYIGSLHPVRVYMDGPNIVVVQSKSSRVESGKYIIPHVSSHLPLGEHGDLVLGSKTCVISIGQGMGAVVCDYRRGQPRGAADRSEPFRPETFRLETNLTASTSGSSR